MENIDQIISDLLAGEKLSDEENKLLSEFTEKYPELYQLLREGRNRKEAIEKFQSSPEKPFERISLEIGKLKKPRSHRLRWFSVAAGILLLAGFFVLFSRINRGEEETHPLEATPAPRSKIFAELILDDGKILQLDKQHEMLISSDSCFEVKNTHDALIYNAQGNGDQVKYNTLNVPTGAEYTLILSDGTKVFLNSGSQLRYPVAFTADSREVFLTGEAFFEVKKDSLKTFIVHSGELKAIVLGTSFNIKSYPEQDKILTTLQEGLLKVVLPQKEYSIKEGTQVVYNKQNQESAMKQVDTELFTSWKDGYYFFNRTPLEEILSTISLWYDLEVSYQDSCLKELPFTGQLKRYDDYINLLEIFERTDEVRFIIRENKIAVEKK